MVHLIVAFVEAGSGLFLLMQICNMIARPFLHLRRSCVAFLVFMHATICANMVYGETRHYRFMIMGWNLQCLFLAIELFWPPLPVVPRKQMINVSVAMAMIWFTILPAFLLFSNRFDPSLANSLWSFNTPKMELELPVNYRPFKELYNRSGLLDNKITAATHDGRHIITADSLELQNAISAGAGYYISKWASVEFARSLCNYLNRTIIDLQDPFTLPSDTRFYLQLPFAGTTLLRSLFAMTGKVEVPALPPGLTSEGCDGVWREFRSVSTLDESLLVARREEKRKVRFSLCKDCTEATGLEVKLVWLRPPSHGIGPGTQRTNTVHVGSLKYRGNAISLITYVGHHFAAVRG